MLTVADVATRLDVSKASVYKLCQVGGLQHVRVLNAIRVESTALDAFIRARSK